MRGVGKGKGGESRIPTASVSCFPHISSLEFPTWSPRISTPGMVAKQEMDSPTRKGVVLLIGLGGGTDSDAFNYMHSIICKNYNGPLELLYSL